MYSGRISRDSQSQIFFPKHKIHSLQIIYMDDKYIYGLYCKNPIQFTIDTYNIDFEGREFHFPEIGMLLFFQC